MNNKNVGMMDDLMFYLNNAVAVENHCLMSFSETKNNQWIEIATLIRKNRSKWLYMFTKENNSEGYCVGKHLAGMSMGLKEMAVRFLDEGNKKLAEECIMESKDCESLFKLINNKEKNKK